MVILTAPSGQTSNRFFQHIHLDAFCRENGIKFYNPYMSDYINDYPNLKPLYSNKYLNLIIRLIDKVKINSKNDIITLDMFQKMGIHINFFFSTTKTKSVYLRTLLNNE